MSPFRGGFASRIAALGVASIGCLGLVQAQAATILVQEDFEGMVGFSGSDPRVAGVPMTNGSTDGESDTSGNADNNWYGARFEQGDSEPIWSDVGAQQFGGGSNNSKVGTVEDDAGILIGINTTGLSNITLSFDWRTFSVTSGDRLVVGYFVGNLATIAASRYTASTRTFDLRNSVHGGVNGVWNWNPIAEGGNTGNWVELMRDISPSSGDPWSSETFNLTGAGNGTAWIAFWMDNGEGDYGKVDNIVVMGTATVIPLPAAVWLLASALGLLGFARRLTS